MLPSSIAGKVTRYRRAAMEAHANAKPIFCAPSTFNLSGLKGMRRSTRANQIRGRLWTCGLVHPGSIYMHQCVPCYGEVEGLWGEGMIGSERCQRLAMPCPDRRPASFEQCRRALGSRICVCTVYSTGDRGRAFCIDPATQWDSDRAGVSRIRKRTRCSHPNGMSWLQ